LSARMLGMSAMLRRVTTAMRVLLLTSPLALTACEWFTDFKSQPSIKPWEVVKDTLTPSRGNPQLSVPTNGTAVQINCAVCHGDRAMGDGPATRYGMPGINLTTDMTKARTDGYIFGMIRNGRGLMPPYNRIEEMDRWDVVNYLRALQGVGGATVAVGPLAAPGVTGDKVPGPTRMGPTEPAPFFNPRSLLNGGRPEAAGAPSASTVPAGGASDTTGRARADSGKRADTTRARRKP